MATTTTNYGYNISEGTDLVNPLTDIFPNFTAIDGDLKSVSNEAITTATELKTGTVHALTRSDADREAIRFTATSNFTAGETFTVDGTQVTALTTSGEALTTGAYIIGSEVFCILKGTLLTMFVSQNITDADTLDGHDSTYFATDADMTQAENDITALSTKVGTAVLTTTAQDCSGAINELNTDLSELNKVLWTNQNPTQAFAPQTVNIDLTNYDAVDITFDRVEGGSCQGTFRMVKNGAMMIAYVPWDQSYMGLRIVNSCTNAGVDFGIGKSHLGADSNACVIPLQIVGVKYN